MAESPLSINFSDLKTAVGTYLGYGADATAWSASQIAEVDLYVQSGIRQFYYPPAVEGVEAGYEWSFLCPSTTLVTASATATTTLPDALGRILGELTHAPSVHGKPVAIVSQAQLAVLASQTTVGGVPVYAAVRDVASDGTAGQRKEIVWWPIPDKVYTLYYRYEAFQGKLTTNNPWPLGGMKHAELITESCLAVAEQRANDEKGLHYESFIRLLAAGIAQDRKNGAHYYGPMGGSESGCESRVCLLRCSEVTYKGTTW